MGFRNHVNLIGNVGASPEDKGKTRTGHAITSFAIAQSTLGLDPATQERVQKEPQWFQVSCFADLAERALSSLSKGALVLVSGELKSKTYQTASGEKRNAVEVVAQEIFRVDRLRKARVEEVGPQKLAARSPDFAEWSGEEETQ